MALANLTAALLGAMVVVVSARALAPTLWAEAAIIIGVGPAIGVTLSLGSVAYQIREIASTESPRLRRCIAAVFNIRRTIVALPIALLGGLLLQTSLSLVGWVLLLGAARFFRGGMGVLFSGERKFGWISLCLVVEKLIALLVILVVWIAGFLSVEAVALAYLLSYLAYATACLCIERVHVPPVVAVGAVRTPWKIWDGSGAFGVASLVGPAQQLDVSVVNWVVGSAEAGLFASASRMLGGLNIAGAALSSVVLPYLSGRRGDISRPPLKSAGVGVILGTLFVGGICILAPVWVPLILGSEYQGAAGAVSVYFVAIAILTVNQPLMASLQAVRDERFVMWIAVMQGGGGLVGVGLGASIGGSTGAAIGYCIVVIVILVALLARARSVLFRRY